MVPYQDAAILRYGMSKMYNVYGVQSLRVEKCPTEQITRFALFTSYIHFHARATYTA